MQRARRLFVIVALLCSLEPANAKAYVPTEEERSAVREKVQALAGELRSIRKDRNLRRKFAPVLVDVDVYVQAGRFFLRFPEEIHDKSYVAKTLAILDSGIERAEKIRAGSAPWKAATGRLARGYRSRLDGSVQPYGLVIPDSYDGKTRMRLDVVLHGRNGKLTESVFLHKHGSPKPLPTGLDRIELHVFGRTNNAYRWAGESDVHEALASVRARYRIDANRIVLRGFSMGGAGVWHLGLHYPHLWAAIEAGAGFSETVRYAKLPNLPPHQLRALRIYDAADYSLNAFNVPTVGYGGENDKQLQASVNIREALMREGFEFRQDGLDWMAPELAPKTPGLRAQFLVGPKTGHKFHPESKKRSDAFVDAQLEAKRRRAPREIRFVTYSTRYGKCHWVHIQGLERHYERAEVRARSTPAARKAEVETKNVSRISIALAQKVTEITLDGHQFPVKPSDAFQLHFSKRSGKWYREERPAKGRVKRPGLQGPIDDAFLGPFLVATPAKPSAKETASAAREYGRAEFARFKKEYAKWLRANIPERPEAKIKIDDPKHNLVLFGDPSSNPAIAKIVKSLPIRWDKKVIRIGKHEYDAKTHVPVFIYPNPRSPDRYIVVNSGHTFGETEFRGTNAYLFPRLGDWAIVRPGPKAHEVVATGFFDEEWKP